MLNNKRKVILILILTVVIFLLPLRIPYSSFADYLNNLLSGSVAIIPATLIVIWQVRAENKSKDEEIEKKHNDEIKNGIYELTACIDLFPSLFNLRYRISVITLSLLKVSRVD
ncbi:hypothetical protein [Lactobacillus sp.]|uniref:hypothetical protein n=1 Tax=Lactobacillus sp. TaxID=1591 RepID=UPI0019C3322A|nr:hypothetical protein [Lactobacillus sp.]MBD5430741.1 hypothetical protein [Lactobacillus sp.]